MKKLLEMIETALPAGFQIQERRKHVLYVTRAGVDVAIVDSKMQMWALIDADGSHCWFNGPEHGLWGGPYLDGRAKARLVEKLVAALGRLA